MSINDMIIVFTRFPIEFLPTNNILATSCSYTDKKPVLTHSAARMDMTIYCKAGGSDVVARLFNQTYVADPESDGNDNGDGARAKLEIVGLLVVSHGYFLSPSP